MKYITLCLIGLILTLQGCALVPAPFQLSKKTVGDHKQKELKSHKHAKQQQKSAKAHPSLKERITLVDFKFFDQAQHKSKKPHKKKLTVPTTGKVSTAFYNFISDDFDSVDVSQIDFSIINFRYDAVEIPWQGTTLMSFLVEHELDDAIVTTRAIINQTVEKDANAQAEKTKQDAIREGKSPAEAARAAELARAAEAAEVEKTENEKIMSILDLHPDVIVLKQGPIATLFPRAMLAYPQIANMPVVPGDAISTLDIDKQNLDAESHLLSTTIEDSTGQTRIQYTLTGFAKQSGRISISEENKEFNINDVTEKYSQEFNENVPAVTVVYRNYGGQLFRIIIPNQHYGALKYPDKAEANASEDEKEAAEKARLKWFIYYDVYERMVIQDGDVIEFTTLDLLDLSSPVRAVSAVQ